MNYLSTVIGYITGFRAAARGQLFIDYNKLLLDFLDYITTNETVNNLDDFFSHRTIMNNDHSNDNLYISTDGMVYSAFRLMNDSVLEDTEVESLEYFVDMALKVDTNPIIIDTILKHLPDDSEYQSQQFRDDIHRFIKPSFYTNLLSENV